MTLEGQNFYQVLQQVYADFLSMPFQSSLLKSKICNPKFLLEDPYICDRTGPKCLQGDYNKCTLVNPL